MREREEVDDASLSGVTTPPLTPVVIPRLGASQRPSVCLHSSQQTGQSPSTGELTFELVTDLLQPEVGVY